MKSIDITALAPPDAYKILIGSIVPRPIAWVSTLGLDGVANVAPFSFFTAVCSNPPTVLFCPVTPADGGTKDTLRNIRDTGEFVVNVATETNVEQMNQTSAPYPAAVSEFDAAALTRLPSVKVKPPRVGQSPIHLECRLTQILPIGEGPGGGHIVVGQVVHAHIDADACSDALHIDLRKIKPVSRLSGSDYAPVHDSFTLKRPTIG